MVTSAARRLTCGVLAVQGGVADHLAIVAALGHTAVALRTGAEAYGPDGPRFDALVIPGGESTVISRLLDLCELREPLAGAIANGVPTLGTCAGLILLARTVRDRGPARPGFAALDVAVRRNAFDPQFDSVADRFEVTGVDLVGGTADVRGALIRGPEIEYCGQGARAIATHRGRVIGATSLDGGDDPDGSPLRRLGSVTGLAFHPEVCGETRFHASLLETAARR